MLQPRGPEADTPAEAEKTVVELLASFTATINDDGNTIAGRREKAPEGRAGEIDSGLTYRKVG
jgi:hypothetical protein